MQNDDAELLRRHRHDEVGMAVGQDALHGALARTLSEPAAAQEAFHARYRPGRCRHRSRIEEPVDAAGDVRDEVIGGEDAGDAGAAEADTQNQCSPAMKNSAHQTIEISIVWPKSGCRMRSEAAAPRRRKARMLPGTSLRLTLSENSQAVSTTKEGLRNSEGWMPRIDQSRSLDLGAEEDRGDDEQHGHREDDEGDAPDLLRRQERDADHQREAGHDEHRLAVDEVEHVLDADALGDRGARGKEQHDPDHHQGEKRRKQEPVHGPPPFIEGGPLCAGGHGRGDPSGSEMRLVVTPLGFRKG